MREHWHGEHANTKCVCSYAEFTRYIIYIYIAHHYVESLVL